MYRNDWEVKLLVVGVEQWIDPETPRNIWILVRFSPVRFSPVLSSVFLLYTYFARNATNNNNNNIQMKKQKYIAMTAWINVHFDGTRLIPKSRVAALGSSQAPFSMLSRDESYDLWFVFFFSKFNTNVFVWLKNTVMQSKLNKYMHFSPKNPRFSWKMCRKRNSKRTKNNTNLYILLYTFKQTISQDENGMWKIGRLKSKMSIEKLFHQQFHRSLNTVVRVYFSLWQSVCLFFCFSLFVHWNEIRVHGAIFKDRPDYICSTIFV